MPRGESCQTDGAGTVVGVEGAVPVQSSSSLRTMWVGETVGSFKEKQGETGGEGKCGCQANVDVSASKLSRHLLAHQRKDSLCLSCHN